MLTEIGATLDIMSTDAEVHGRKKEADRLEKMAELAEEVATHILGCKVK